MHTKIWITEIGKFLLPGRKCDNGQKKFGIFFLKFTRGSVQFAINLARRNVFTIVRQATVWFKNKCCSRLRCPLSVDQQTDCVVVHTQMFIISCSCSYFLLCDAVDARDWCVLSFIKLGWWCENRKVRLLIASSNGCSKKLHTATKNTYWS